MERELGRCLWQRNLLGRSFDGILVLHKVGGLGVRGPRSRKIGQGLTLVNSEEWRPDFGGFQWGMIMMATYVLPQASCPSPKK